MIRGKAVIKHFSEVFKYMYSLYQITINQNWDVECCNIFLVPNIINFVFLAAVVGVVVCLISEDHTALITT